MNRFARKLALPICFALIAGVACGGDDEEATQGRDGRRREGRHQDRRHLRPLRRHGRRRHPLLEGIRDYIEYKNATGGVDGHKLALSWQDFKYNPDTAGQLYGQYVSEGAKVFMGWGTADTEALRPRVTSDKVPFMSASLAETLTDPEVTPYNFFPAASYSQQMRIAAPVHLRPEQGQAQVEVAFFHHDSPFGTSPARGREEVHRRQEARHRLEGLRHADGRHRLRGPDRAGQVAGRQVPRHPERAVAGRHAGHQPGCRQDRHPVRLPELLRQRDLREEGRRGRREDASPSCRSPRRWRGRPGSRRSTTSSRRRAPTPSAEGPALRPGLVHDGARWWRAISNALRPTAVTLDRRDDQGRRWRRSPTSRPPLSDPITFTATYHAGLLSSPLYQVEGGVFKKIQDPIKIER